MANVETDIVVFKSKKKCEERDQDLNWMGSCRQAGAITVAAKKHKLLVVVDSGTCQ